MMKTRGHYNTSLHYSILDTQHPLRSGTDTHVGPEVPIQTPRPWPTSDFLSPPSFPQIYPKKSLWPGLNCCQCPGAATGGRPGAVEGSSICGGTHPGTCVCPACKTQCGLVLAGVPLWAGDCWRYSVPMLLCESECLGLCVPLLCLCYFSFFLMLVSICLCIMFVCVYNFVCYSVSEFQYLCICDQVYAH